MSLENLIDTILNLVVFVYIGVLVWLYRQPMRGGDYANSDRDSDD